MHNFKVNTYLIECLTNLHVGSGNNDYGVIDKQVQRDPVTNLPVIHASGLKGAIREYFEQFYPETASTSNPEKTICHPTIAHIFGTDKGESGTLQQGKYRFFEAQLLVLPIRGTGNKPFYRGTTSSILNLLNVTSKALGSNLEISLTPNSTNTSSEVFEEAGKDATENTTTYLGGDVLLLLDKEMAAATKHLPIIARNKLENGQSENLWYEEIVPRESRFSFSIAYPEGDAHIADFNSKLHEKTVQIGANATVGYGYCKITKIS